MISITPAMKPEGLPEAIKFSNNTAIKKESSDQWEIFDGALIVRNVQVPELYVFSPPKNVVNRKQAILVVPGGGMMMLAFKHEGIEVAQHLAQEGYTAFVLKYRVNPTPIEIADFKQLSEEFITQNSGTGFGNFQIRLDTSIGVEDAIQACDFIKANASQYNVNAGKMHYIGFSAGAVLGQELMRIAPEHSKPITLACIYGDMRRIAMNSKNPPPLFLVLANDDPFFSRQGFEIIRQWQELGQKVEFHLFEDGGHGFGMTQKRCTSDGWVQLYTQWVKKQNP